MDVFVCRLCLDLLKTGGEAKPFVGRVRDIVQIVVPGLNLDVSLDPSICIKCLPSLARLYQFKSRVLDLEGKVREKVGNYKSRLVARVVSTDREQPGGGGAEGVPPVDSKAKFRMCRTCLIPTGSESFLTLRPSEPDPYLSSMLSMCLAEVDLELTMDPVMCATCHDHLQKLHRFVSSCRDVEAKIVNYRDWKGVAEGDSVDLHSMLEAYLLGEVKVASARRNPRGAGSGEDETEDVAIEDEVEKISEDRDGKMSEGDESDGLEKEVLDIESDAGTGNSDNFRAQRSGRREPDERASSRASPSTSSPPKRPREDDYNSVPDSSCCPRPDKSLKSVCSTPSSTFSPLTIEESRSDDELEVPVAQKSKRVVELVLEMRETINNSIVNAIEKRRDASSDLKRIGRQIDDYESRLKELKRDYVRAEEVFKESVNEVKECKQLRKRLS